MSEDSSSTRVERRELLIRCAPSFRTRRYFSRHSVRGNSLQDYPSFAGETVGTRIDRDNSLIMPPSFVRQLRNNTAQSDGTTVKLGARYGRRLATPIPSSNTHIPCISTLRTSRNLPQPQRSCYITCAQRRYHCCHRQQYHARVACISLSSPCGSHLEQAHTVYKNALIKQRYNYLFFSFNSAKEVAILDARRALL